MKTYPILSARMSPDLIRAIDDRVHERRLAEGRAISRSRVVTDLVRSGLGLPAVQPGAHKGAVR